MGAEPNEFFAKRAASTTTQPSSIEEEGFQVEPPTFVPYALMEWERGAGVLVKDGPYGPAAPRPAKPVLEQAARPRHAPPRRLGRGLRRAMLEGREWFSVEGASPEALAKLQACAPARLPDSYLAFLSYSNGGEGPLAVQPYNLVLDPAETVAAGVVSEAHDESFPGFLMIGGSGGGELVALDLRNRAPWPVVSIDMTNIDLSESIQPIAEDFDAFLELVGVEAAEA